MQPNFKKLSECIEEIKKHQGDEWPLRSIRSVRTVYKIGAATTMFELSMQIQAQRDEFTKFLDTVSSHDDANKKFWSSVSHFSSFEEGMRILAMFSVVQATSRRLNAGESREKAIAATVESSKKARAWTDPSIFTDEFKEEIFAEAGGVRAYVQPRQGISPYNIYIYIYIYICMYVSVYGN